MRGTLIGISIIVFVSCKSKEDRLFWVDEKRENKSDFLYIAESVNVEALDQDSLRFYLFPDELAELKIEDSISFKPDSLAPVYKNYGKIYESGRFRLYVLFRNQTDTLGRDYTFLLRSFSPNWDIIDSYELAVWNKEENYYCFGSVNEELIIRKECLDTDTIEIMQVTRSGNIVQSSYQPPQ